MSADHRRCSVCGTGVPAGVLCVEHAALSVLANAIRNGTRSDWPPPPPPMRTLVTHQQFMTSHWATHPAFTWRAQLAALLAYHNIILDDGEDESGQE